MTIRSLLRQLAAQEDLNFLLTNRIPRLLATRFVGRVSRIEHPLVRIPSLWLWRLFTDLDLSEAKATRFPSMHACFTRELKAGARPIDPRPDIIVSPCDAIIGSFGQVEGETLVQAKGFTYTLSDLFGDAQPAAPYRNGVYVTLRLTAGMYHRFHAPSLCRVKRVTYISGDTWNVNPIALERIEKLFCKNERAAIEAVMEPSAQPLALVAVAAILVGSIRLHFLDLLLYLGYRGPRHIDCDQVLDKGAEMGWFEHGSTIIVFGAQGVRPCESLREGNRVRMGEPLLRLC
ncbi:MAG: phosphatidylserine decarboxylase [Betaproteobacteria bacterium]|nr:phosphatidylserine decarboxylase [Betaproteobacteria bacterium]